MAQSRRNDSQRLMLVELEQPAEGDRAENLDIGHARLRSECWAAVPNGAPRSRRPRRKRTRLHCSRPSVAAEAHFILSEGEFLE